MGMGRMLAESGGIPGKARRRRAAAWLVAVFAATTLSFSFACGRGDGTRSAAGAPVILISVDTLRADHLPAYGYRGVATPGLDALRRDSVLFQNAYSHVPLTLPSHTTIFTGLLPPQNGVRDNLGYALSPGPATLASWLKTKGYATGGAVSSIVLSHATGISRGFDFYEDGIEPTKASQIISRVQRGGAETASVLTEWIHARGKTPFFAFLHLFEPHTPYEPPEPYKSRYPLAYDGEIARADEIVGTFLEDLKTQGLYDRALIVFLSDHGEGLNDHGEDEHGVLLYREAIHVPLMVKLPGKRRAGETVSSPVALVDVFPTVAEALGAAPPAGLAGRPLFSATASGNAARRVYSETLYPRLHLGWSDLASLIDDRDHYIDSPRPELYDIVADPGEKNDLSAALPPAFRSMRIELAGMVRPMQAPGGTDAEQVKKLAALGYISANTSDLAKKDLPAPRDRIGDVAELKKGFTALQVGRYAESAEVLAALLKREPGMTDVWQMYAEALGKLGRDKEALEALQTAARLSPGNPQVLMALSDYYLQVGDFEQARKHAEAVGEAGTASPHENLARIALAEGDLDTAEREARAALERYPDRRVPRLILGRVLHDRKDCLGAMTELDRAAKTRAAEARVSLQNLQYLRGDCLARMGRFPEAEAAFRDEMRDFPSNPAPRTGLAMLYASQGREAEARQSLTGLVRDLGTPEAYFAAAKTYEILGDAASAHELQMQAKKLFPSAKERKAGG
jgi:Flp pilus assembly protein TadD